MNKKELALMSIKLECLDYAMKTVGLSRGPSPLSKVSDTKKHVEDVYKGYTELIIPEKLREQK